MLKNLLNKAKSHVPTINLNEAWQEYGSKIEKLVIDKLLDTTEEKLVEETDIRNIINVVYELLPTPVRFILPRDFVANKILERKGPLLIKVTKLRENREVRSQLVIVSDPQNSENIEN